MGAETALDEARRLFGQHRWVEAHARLTTADHESPLGAPDLERLAVAAYLIGRDDESARSWERAHHEQVRAHDLDGAVRCAFWLGLGLLLRGEPARGGGWFTRARRLLDEAGLDCAGRGYLLVPVALHSLGEGDPAGAYVHDLEAGRIGQRFRDPDLIALARLGQAKDLIAMGHVVPGVALLDELMVTVTTGEVSAVPVGIVYCGVLLACQDIFDLPRAQEWTSALSVWCESQPDLVPYRGQCLVHRAEVMLLHGEWPQAQDEAIRACDQLSGHPALGSAYYQRAELNRLCGAFAAAEEAYRAASQRGRDPQPGLAQLRLAQGQVQEAQASIRRVLDQAGDRLARSKVLAAYVEIVIAAGDTRSARTAADDLAQIAADFDAPFLHAAAAHALGAVMLADGDAAGACAALRGAWLAWQSLEAPYEAARARVLVGLALRELGDHDSATMELDAARWVFQQLGAAPDLARVDEHLRPAGPGAAGGLSAREVQVLGLVAMGRSNREIATTLVISEHTVRRHLQNIFAKLDVSSRSAATAFAFQHELV
jgi:DNA-binding CsgD family transcriptional regulator